PDECVVVSRTGTYRRAAHSRGREGRGIHRADRYSRAGAGGRGRGGGGHSANPRVPVPADRSVGGGGADRTDCESEERAIRLAAGFPPCSGESRLDWEFEDPADGAGILVRLQQPGGRYARP